MAKTRTSGITVDADGQRTVNKQVLGKTIFHRLGSVSQEEAERWLASAIERVQLERSRGTRPRITFREGAIRYLSENRELSSIDDAAWHVELLDPWIGGLALEDLCDETLEPFKKHRLEADHVTLTTVNRSLEIVRRVLNLAARQWRHPNRLTWLETAPLITIEQDKKARPPYPLSWDEQRRFFSKLPADPNGQMALFKVNTGTREQEVCALEWGWEVKVQELDTSVFVVPGDIVKNEEDRLVVLNDVARSVVEARRGIHPRWGVHVPWRSPRLHEQHGVAECAHGRSGGAGEGERKEGAMGLRPRARARPQAHLRPAAARGWGTRGDAQGVAGAQERRHHDALLGRRAEGVDRCGPAHRCEQGDAGDHAIEGEQ